MPMSAAKSRVHLFHRHCSRHLLSALLVKAVAVAQNSFLSLGDSLTNRFGYYRAPDVGRMFIICMEEYRSAQDRFDDLLTGVLVLQRDAMVRNA